MGDAQILVWVIGQRHGQVGAGVHVEEDRLTRAGRPSRNMSCASLRRTPGRSVTRLPRAIRRPGAVMASVSGETEASAAGSHQGTAGS